MNLNLLFIKISALLFFSIFLTENSFSAGTNGKINKPMIVIIDPGHGGKDPGAVNKGIQEKDVVLGIGLKLGKYINETYPDVKVIYTRSTDVFVPLIERSRIANKNKSFKARLNLGLVNCLVCFTIFFFLTLFFTIVV